MSGTPRPLDAGGGPAPPARDRLVSVTLDPASIKRNNANIDHERQVAIYDILEANEFQLIGRDDGPYALTIGVVDDRLAFAVTPASGGSATLAEVPMTPLRRVMRDYFMVCETYFEAIRTAPPSRIQQIDSGRRALHDEGAKALVERLAAHVRVDATTGRRLFTLVCALHWRG